MDYPVMVRFREEYFGITAYLRPQYHSAMLVQRNKIEIEQVDLPSFEETFTRFYMAWASICGLGYFSDVLAITDEAGNFWREIPYNLSDVPDGNFFGVVLWKGPPGSTENEAHQVIWGARRGPDGRGFTSFHNFSKGVVIHSNGDVEY